MRFVSLHNHSDYSLLDGASQLPALVERAVALGMDDERPHRPVVGRDLDLRVEHAATVLSLSFRTRPRKAG